MPLMVVLTFLVGRHSAASAEDQQEPVETTPPQLHTKVERAQQIVRGLLTQDLGESKAEGSKLRKLRDALEDILKHPNPECKGASKPVIATETGAKKELSAEEKKENGSFDWKQCVSEVRANASTIRFHVAHLMLN